MNYYAKQIAVLVTATVMVAVIILLCVLKLSWPGDNTPPPGPDPFIELAVDETFVEPILDPKPMSHTDVEAAPAQTPEPMIQPSNTAPTSGTALQDKGDQGQPAQPVTQTRPSTVKTTPKTQPEKPGATKPKPDPKAQTQRMTNNQVANAFANTAKNNASNDAKDQGRAGNPKGSPNSTGAPDSKSSKTGIGSRSLGGGWVWPAVSNRVKADKTGSVIVEFVVDPKGNVIKADAVGGEAPAASLYGAQCVAIVKGLKFTRNDTRVPEHNTTGHITFTFK